MNSICNIHQDHNRMSTATKTKLEEVFVEVRERMCVCVCACVGVCGCVFACSNERMSDTVADKESVGEFAYNDNIGR